MKIDDRAVGEGELSAAILVDPGNHRIVVTAPGHEAREIIVTAGSGEVKEVALTPGPALATTSVPLPPTAPTASVITPAPAPAASGFLSQHKVSLALVGGGVVLAVAGVAEGVDIISGPYKAFVVKCSARGACLPEEQAAMQGRMIAVNALVAAGTVAGLTALGLFFFNEGGLSPKAQVAVGPTSANLTVRW